MAAKNTQDNEPEIDMNNYPVNLEDEEQSDVLHRNMHCFRVPGHPRLRIVRHQRVIEDEPRWGYGLKWRKAEVRSAHSVEQLTDKVEVETAGFRTVVTVFEKEQNKLRAIRQFPANKQGEQAYQEYMGTLATTKEEEKKDGKEAEAEVGTMCRLHGLIAPEDPQ